jgi:hypothetical protein
MADRALVVGIECYAAPAATKLQGPSKNAIQFARWLVQRQGVPAANVILIHNRSDAWDGDQSYFDLLADIKALGIESRDDPSRRAIAAAWQEELIKPPIENGTLWIYWSGHGVSLPPGRDVVLCADVEERNPSFIYLGEFRDSLRSKAFFRFPRQRIIVDACSEYMKLEALGFTKRREPDFFEHATDPEQVEINAVPMGSKARAEKGGSLFSRVLFTELGESKWPDDLKAFHQKITAAIATEEHRPKLRISSPTYEYGLETSRNAVECREIIETLAQCGIDFRDYRPLYLKAIGPFSSDPGVLRAGTLTSMIEELFQMKRDDLFGGFSEAVVGFLSRVALAFPAAAVSVRDWLKANVPVGTRTTLERRLEREKSEMVLAIQVIETALNPNRFPASIQAFLSDAELASPIMQWSSPNIADVAALECEVREIINDAAAKARSSKDVAITVRVFANQPLLSVPWHTFAVDPADEDCDSFGQLHSFVLGSRARLMRTDYQYDFDTWKSKSLDLGARSGSAIPVLAAPPWSDQTVEKTKDWLAKAEGLLMIRDVMTADSGCTRLFRSALRKGQPLVTWLTRPEDGSHNLEEEIRKLLDACQCVDDSPKKLLAARKSEAWARQTVLFWDSHRSAEELVALFKEPSQL